MARLVHIRRIGLSMFLRAVLRGMTEQKIGTELRCSEGECISVLTILVFINFRTTSTFLLLLFDFILQG